MTRAERAAIYARRSTEQHVAEEAKSVTRQVENGRAFAATKGWTVPVELIFADDGVSGAEFKRRTGLQRLLAAAERGEFTRLIVAEQKALGREMSETAYLIKQLAQAGVEVWAYMEERCLTPKNTTDKLLGMVQGFADEDHRVKSSQRMHEAHARLARAGRAIGNRVFGYRNVRVTEGKDSSGNDLLKYVDREIIPEEATSVVRIFTLTAEGLGLKAVAKRLNAEGALSPRPFRRKDGSRPTPAWYPCTVRDVLLRDIYRGVVVWNRYKKRDEWGQVSATQRPKEKWITAERPDLRIVSDELWHRAQALRATRNGHERLGRARKDGAVNLLSGLAKCGLCESGMVCETSGGPRRDAFDTSHLPGPEDAGLRAPRADYRYWCCWAHRHKGTCDNALRIPAELLENEVLLQIEEHVFTEEHVEEFITLNDGDDVSRRRSALEKDADELDRRIEKVLAAIEVGGSAVSLVARVKELEVQRDALRAQASALRPVPPPAPTEVRQRLDEWRHQLRSNPREAREVLSRVIAGRVVITPWPDGQGYEYEFANRFHEVFAGGVFLTPLAAPVDGILDALGLEEHASERDAEKERLLRTAEGKPRRPWPDVTDEKAGNEWRPWWDSNPRSPP